MDKHLYGFLLIFCIILSLALVSFISCFLAESKKAKKEEIKLDNELCYLPESRAFSFGIAALTCLVIAQFIGNLVICSDFWVRKDGNSSKSKKPKTVTAFLVLSWISFGLAMILLSTATSMSGKQEYGKEWLDQHCYIVKDGVFIGSGFLVLTCIAATLTSAFLTTINKPQADQGTRVHAQAVS